jgi:hypothetical protein
MVKKVLSFEQDRHSRARHDWTSCGKRMLENRVGLTQDVYSEVCEISRERGLSEVFTRFLEYPLKTFTSC